MKATAGRLCTFAFLAGLGVLLPACGDKGQLVLGIATDLLARGQINRVTMQVRRTGEETPIVDYKWDLAGMPAVDYRLPGSFTLVAEGGQEPTFEVIVRGMLTDPLLPGGLGDKQVVERRARLGVLSGSDLFFRLGLVGACEQLGCPGSLACVEGSCRPLTVDLRALPSYRSALVERLACDSGPRYLDTGTGAPMPSDTSCGSGSLCGEGTCLADPATLPSADPRPFVGGPAELYASAHPPGDFFPVGALDAARFFASATLLTDGRVLVVGGDDRASLDGSAQPVPGAVIYEPGTASFRRLADPPAHLSGHTATRIESGPGAGTVVFIGAAAGVASAFEFDPATERFTALPPPMARRYFHTTSVLANNKLLVYGGTASKGGAFSPVGGAELFDLFTHTWTPTKVGPVRTRAFHSASPLPDGRVLFIGGLDASGVPLAEVEAYDPTVDEFRSELALRRPRAVHTATALSDGTTLLVGGQGDQRAVALADAELYVPGGQATPIQPDAPPLARTAHQAVLLGGDRVLFLDGASSTASPQLTAAGGAFFYDHATRSFTRLPDPKRARIKGFAVRLADGDVLVGGGSAEISPASDGGLLVDASVMPDLSTIYCDPVGVLGAALCSGATPRCGVAGQREYGPRFTTVAGPACVAAGSIAVGLPCGGIATAPVDLGMSGDDCVSGSLCLPDEFDTLFCQVACHVDMDCAAAPAGHNTCARILTGPGLDTVGVCMRPCLVFSISGEDCMLGGGGMCRYVLNQVSSAAQVLATGVCMAAGQNAVDAPCDRNSSGTECSFQGACIKGTCEYACEDQARCDQFASGSKCTGLAPAAPSNNGYCSQLPDMRPPGPDLRSVGLD